MSAGHAKALTTLPCSVAVSRKRGRAGHWGGREGKVPGEEENVASHRAKSCSLAFLVFSAAGGVEFSASLSSFSPLSLHRGPQISLRSP